MRYRMIGIDLDGTLLDSTGVPPEANLRAIRDAREAGVRVVPCTGRSWCESRMVTAQLDGIERGVFVTGAAVCHLDDGRSVDLAVIEPNLAHRIVEHLSDGPEAVLVFRERYRCGHDYLVTGRGELTPNTRWWFEQTGANVHFQREVTPVDLHHTLRVGLVAPGSRAVRLTEKLRGELGGGVIVHSFAAVQMPNPEESVYILEAFAAGVDKWRGLTWLAREHGIAPGEIAVIGDEINDVSMLSSAGCGIAMGNATKPALDAARYVTLSQNEAGVAHAIGKLLTGEWV
ncbi:MAG: HAD hydrolase family protein [Phycisphaera sp.]|nr:HAD hydrolase family protein [Phycisphaera sp.]